MAKIPEKAKTGFLLAAGVLAALVVFHYVQKRLPLWRSSTSQS